MFSFLKSMLTDFNPFSSTNDINWLNERNKKVNVNIEKMFDYEQLYYFTVLRNIKQSS